MGGGGRGWGRRGGGRVGIERGGVVEERDVGGPEGFVDDEVVELVVLPVGSALGWGFLGGH